MKKPSPVCLVMQQPASYGVKHTQEMQETKNLEGAAYATAPWRQGKA